MKLWQSSILLAVFVLVIFWHDFMLGKVSLANAKMKGHTNAEGRKSIMSKNEFAVPKRIDASDTFLRQFDGVCHDTKGAHVRRWVET